MNLILLTKSNESGLKANAALRRLLPGFDVETIFAAPGDRLPERASWACDWLISFLCPWILPARILDQARDTLNFHPGPPDYPGFGCYNFALYDGAANYGVTCHRMATIVDSGQIVGVRTFAIDDGSTAADLQEKSHFALSGIFEEIVMKIGNGEDLPQIAEWSRPPTNRADFEALRKIPDDADRDELLRRVRAFAHPDHDGAYFERHGVHFIASREALKRPASC